MPFKHTRTVIINDGITSLQGVQSIDADGRVDSDVSLEANDAGPLEVVMAVPFATVRSVAILATGSGALLETNNASAPAVSLTVGADAPATWMEPDGGKSPLHVKTSDGTDVDLNKVFISRAPDAPLDVKLAVSFRFLLDSTP